MKRLILCLVLAFGVAQFNCLVASEQKIGFTGEVQEILLKRLTPKPPTANTTGIIDGSKMRNNVEVLMIGFSKLTLDDPDFEMFYFVTYYYPETSSDSWIGVIVVNHGETDLTSATLSIEVKGPINSKIEEKRTIPRLSAVLYKYKFNKRFSKDEIGCYELAAQISRSNLWTSRAVTRLYIEEIW